MNRRSILSCALASFLVPALVPAQGTTPESAMRAFIAAVQNERWQQAANLIDLRTFDRWRREQVETIRRRPSMRRMTAEQLMQQDSTMPRAVAEWQAARYNEAQLEVARYPLRDFAEVPSVDSLERLSAREAAARWLRGRDPRWQYRQSLQASGCKRDSVSVREALELAVPDPVRVIGAIVRDSIAYVVVQEELRSPGEYGREPHDVHPPSRVYRMIRLRSVWKLRDWEQWWSGNSAAVVCQ